MITVVVPTEDDKWHCDCRVCHQQLPWKLRDKCELSTGHPQPLRSFTETVPQVRSGESHGHTERGGLISMTTTPLSYLKY